MCMNRPIPGSPFHTATASASVPESDFPPGIPREEVWADPIRIPGLDRAKRIARIVGVTFRQLYRTNTGYILIWTSVWLWGLYAATRILGIK